MTDLIQATFGAQLPVTGVMTTRCGGVSVGAYGALDGGKGLNLGDNCGDAPDAVRVNRSSLQSRIGHPITWMQQVHGTNVHRVLAEEKHRVGASSNVVADAMITTATNHGLGVLAADCLPVLLASDSVIGVAHAGWRGLSAGVLNATVSAMNEAGADNGTIHAWFGAAIGSTAFEVGEDVVQAFANSPNSEKYFVSIAGRSGKWWCDLYGLAREQLNDIGVGSVRGGDLCTARDPSRFFSYRRDGQCGRMAGVILRVAS